MKLTLFLCVAVTICCAVAVGTTEPATQPTKDYADKVAIIIAEQLSGRPGTQPVAGLPGRALKDQPTEGGELIWLDHGLSNGVLARRTFNDKGRVLREIQYALNDSAPPNARVAKDPSALAEWSTTVNEYDRGGRLTRALGYDSVRELAGYNEFRYGSDGQKELETRYSPEGIRQLERRYHQGSKRPGQLQFDAKTGRRLLCFDGPVPSDVDLAEGWGEVSGGLQYGIVPSSHAPDCILSTIKNVSNADIEVPRSTITLQTHLELTDADGAIIAYDKKAVESSSRVTEGGIGKLPPGHAGSEFYRLPDWYGKLQPGRYTLRIRRLGPDRKQSLVSNTLQIVIPTPSAVFTAMQDRLRVEVFGGYILDIFPDKVVENFSGQGGHITSGTGMTVEGVTIRWGLGKVQFTAAGQKWTAWLAQGQVQLVNEENPAKAAGFRGPRLKVSMWNGNIDVSGNPVSSEHQNGMDSIPQPRR